ncbi:unnamed protein product [Parascedosporium putredinis]|uniref:Enoyl reductase (ER) domain-containing protein n=1 Tax=Parascedosporium putredinis TaxID=1442378 RepID=A0A9P1M9V7_9PEZI|nr:unnamed protein product [Parascedosporium putredinis]CAI7996301.1 unnamed protein product [Parascedosporium putredinis]
MARRWVMTNQDGFELSLKLEENLPVPEDLAENDVLVELHGASLNYRELVIAKKPGQVGPISQDCVPGSDGAGIVKAVGAAVTEFKPGDRVITLLSPDTVEKGGDEAFPDFPAISDGLGQRRNGTLQTHGVFPQTALVHGPKSIGWIEASTLTCSGLTAYNSLFGFQGKQVSAGDWVLTQGTGGVSVAALQLAVAAGATVVATTSSDAKAERLRALGATHVVNYHANPEGWGEQAKALTPDGAGFDFIVDIGGDATLGKCVPAAKTDGIVVLAGLRGSGSRCPYWRR